MDKFNSEVVSINIMVFILSISPGISLYRCFVLWPGDYPPLPVSSIPLPQTPPPSTIKPVFGICHLQMIFPRSYNSLSLPVQQTSE